MVVDPAAPATKQDVALIMESISGLYEAISSMRKRFDEVDIKIAESEDRTKRHFDVVVETLEHDLGGAFRDHTSVNANRFTAHDRRITRLERHTGLVSR
jgi:hypothetical protein